MKEQRPGFTLSETGEHCCRDQNSGGGHLGRHLYHHGDVLSDSVACWRFVVCARFSCIIYL